MENVKSQFKYTIDLGVSATKSIFKLKKTTKDRVMHVLVLVFIAIMGAVVSWDVARDASFTIDLIILIALVVIEIFSLVMPFIILNTQKKFLRQLDLEQFDHTITEISKGKCTESYYKDNKIVMQNVCDMSTLVNYEIKANHLFAVFNNFACAIFDLTTLSVQQTEFEQLLNSIIVKNKSNKYKKR